MFCDALKELQIAIDDIDFNIRQSENNVVYWRNEVEKDIADGYMGMAEVDRVKANKSAMELVKYRELKEKMIERLKDVKVLCGA